MANKTRDNAPKKATDAEPDRGRVAAANVKVGQVIRIPKGTKIVSPTHWSMDTFLEAGVMARVEGIACLSVGSPVRVYTEDGGAKTLYLAPSVEEVELITDPETLEEWFATTRKAELKNFSIPTGYNYDMKVGSDPEIFVLDKDGVVMPAFDFLGDKAGSRGYAQPYWDGFQAEWNVHPSHCHAWVIDDVHNGLAAVITAAKKKDKNAVLTWKSVVDVSPEMLKKAKPEHVQFGCSPSLNAYDDKLVIPDGSQVPIRFAGCHVHLGYKEHYGKMEGSECARIVRCIDRIVGPVMTAMLEGLEDPRRRAFYGRAGEYRLPAHGIEYRVPSSTVMCNPLITHIVFDLVRYAGSVALSHCESFWLAETEQTKAIINDYDIAEARKNIAANKVMLKAMLNKLYGNVRKRQVYDLIMEGARNVVDCDNMHETWLIGKVGMGKAWSSHSESPNVCVKTSFGGTDTLYPDKE